MKRVVWFIVAAMLVLGALPIVRTREWRSLSDEVRRSAGGDFVRLTDGVVHYEIGGPENGPVVVLVHGFSVPMYVWDSTFSALTGAGFRVIRYDLFGRGYSDRPEGSYDRARFVRQLDELLSALRVRRPVAIVGYSLGGAITAAYVASHPSAIDKVVLIAPFNTPVDIAPLDRPGVGEYLAYAHVVPSLPKNQMQYLVQPERYSAWGERFLEQMRFRGFARATLSIGRDFATRDPISDFRAVGALQRPVLLIWGDHDKAVPFEQNPRVRAALGDAIFRSIPGVGHLPQVERAELLNVEIVRFLRSGAGVSP